MRRIQIYIPEDIDDRLKLEAARLNRSKASLIRECVGARFGTAGRDQGDPFTALMGTVDIEPEDIDEVVYGR